MLVGSAAFTLGEVDRQATIDVVNDNTALTGLAAGSSSLVHDDSGVLTMDFSQLNNADGVNANSTYEIGDHNAANETYAFNITNNHDTNTYDYTLSYAFDDSTLAGNGSVTFALYDSTGGLLGETTDASDASATLDAGQVAYVVVTVDSDSTAPGDDLSGTLTVTAN